MFLNSADLEQIPELRREKGGLEREVTSLCQEFNPIPASRPTRAALSQSPSPPGQPRPSLPSNLPGFPLAIDKEVVKEEEGSLLDIAGGDF